MILLDSTPESPFKSPIPRNEHDSDSQPVEVDVPPAYGQQPPHSPNSTSPLLSRVKDGQSSNWRFLKAFFVAALILSALVASTFKIIYFARSRHLPRQIQNPNHNIKGWPESSDGIAERCVGGRDWEPYSSPDWALFPYRSRNTFRLPVALNALGIFSRGSFSIGVISVLDSEDGGDHIEVEVLTSYSSQEALDRASVCLLRREDGGKGIGIFTPKHWGNVAQKDLLLFNITVYLPVRHSHIYVNSFETDLPLFVHNFGDLAKTVNFRRLSLKGSQAPMNVKSLSAEYASVTNSEEQIVGSFNVSTSLNLHTNRHVIEAQISLSNDPSGRATTLNMTTSKAYIDSTISLISTNSTGGSFNVSAKTSDNPLRIHYETSPLNSILHHHSESSSSPVSVKLDSAYEGSFTLQSSNISPSVEKKDVKDPSGMHRYRWLDVFHIRGDYLTGDVFWNAWKWPNPVESKGRGVVNIKTSNSPARLYL